VYVSKKKNYDVLRHANSFCLRKRDVMNSKQMQHYLNMQHSSNFFPANCCLDLPHTKQQWEEKEKT